MTKRSLFLAVFLIGCGGRVSLGDHGSGDNSLTGAESAKPDAAPTDAGGSSGFAVADAGPADSAPPSGTIAPSDIDYIEDDETTGHTGVKIRVYGSCRVTDHTGLDAMGEASRCAELFDHAIVPTTSGCGGSVPVGTLRLHLKDGRDYVRDMKADACSVKLPGQGTHKMTWAAWYSAGGG